jgi:hypothetical protein
MTVSPKKRSGERTDCRIPIPIQVSIFNSKCSIEAQLVDHCMDGMSFISDQAFFLGTPIVIRVAHGNLEDSCNRDIERLPGMRIGEVKWCKMLPAEASKSYEVGIKYYCQDY